MGRHRGVAGAAVWDVKWEEISCVTQSCLLANVELDGEEVGKTCGAYNSYCIFLA